MASNGLLEVWGWKKRQEIEKTNYRYIKWVMVLEKDILGYMIREEGERDKLKGRVRLRA